MKFRKSFPTETGSISTHVTRKLPNLIRFFFGIKQTAISALFSDRKNRRVVENPRKVKFIKLTLPEWGL